LHNKTDGEAEPMGPRARSDIAAEYRVTTNIRDAAYIDKQAT